MRDAAAAAAAVVRGAKLVVVAARARRAFLCLAAVPGSASESGGPLSPMSVLRTQGRDQIWKRGGGSKQQQQQQQQQQHVVVKILSNKRGVPPVDTSERSRKSKSSEGIRSLVLGLVVGRVIAGTRTGGR
jgi:hypothetical protein